MRAETHESIDIALAWLTTERLQISRQQLGQDVRLNVRHGLCHAQPTGRGHGERWRRGCSKDSSSSGARGQARMIVDFKSLIFPSRSCARHCGPSEDGK